MTSLAGITSNPSGIYTTTFYTSLISMIVITIAVLAKSSPKNSAEFVFATYKNENDWSPPFTAFVVGLIKS